MEGSVVEDAAARSEARSRLSGVVAEMIAGPAGVPAQNSQEQ